MLSEELLEELRVNQLRRSRLLDVREALVEDLETVNALLAEAFAPGVDAEDRWWLLDQGRQIQARQAAVWKEYTQLQQQAASLQRRL